MSNDPTANFPTSRWEVYAEQDQTKNTTLDIPQNRDNDLPQNTSNFFSSYLLPTLLVILVIGGFYLIPNLTHYLSLSPYCNIEINEQAPGFKEDIISKLNSIKSQNLQEFQAICQSVSTIGEDNCPVSDEGDSGTTNSVYVDHCFVKGTKTIYLEQSTIDQLEKMAQSSQSYWVNH